MNISPFCKQTPSLYPLITGKLTFLTGKNLNFIFLCQIKPSQMMAMRHTDPVIG